MKRRSVAIGSAIACALVLASIAALIGWLPGRVRSRVREAAARRGLSATISGVDVGLRAISLAGVRLESCGHAMVIDIDRIRVDSAATWLTSTAVRTVGASHVRIQLDLDNRCLESALRALRP